MKIDEKLLKIDYDTYSIFNMPTLKFCEKAGRRRHKRATR